MIFPSKQRSFKKVEANEEEFCPLLPVVANIEPTSNPQGLSRWSSGKESAYSAEDLGSIPGCRKSPGEGNGNLLQYPCLEKSMNRGTWWATVHGVTKSQTCLSE